MSNSILVFIFISWVSVISFGKEIALTFDDAPRRSTPHFETHARTTALIQKLKDLNVPPVMIFANPCNRPDQKDVLAQLKAYRDAGHLVGNHTCSHPHLDEVGLEAFKADMQKADQLLTPFFSGQKFFRFPFFNEGKDEKVRDQVRVWLKEHAYRNGFATVDTDDTVLSERLNVAKKLGKKINYDKVQELYVKHVVGAAEFYEALALEQLGRSPKHVVLLHEIDSSVLFIEALVKELRSRGWKIISAEEAYKDPVYLSSPKNTYSGNALLSQLYYEKIGYPPKYTFYQWEEMTKDLNQVLGLK